MAKKISEMSATERKAKREADRDRQQRLRDKKKLGDVALTPEQQRTALEARWAANRAALSPEKRTGLEARIVEATRVHNLMIRGSRLLRSGAAYGAEGFYVDLAFEEIENFAKSHSPTDSVSFSDRLERGQCTLADISEASESFQSYGEELDSIDHVLYYDFIFLFKTFYQQFRNSGVCEKLWITAGDADENGALLEPDSWDRVDELFNSNPRLAPIISGDDPSPSIIKKVPAHIAAGFETPAQHQAHLANLAREQKRADFQRAAAALSLLAPEERQKMELLERFRQGS
jgi:hypothetical protein